MRFRQLSLLGALSALAAACSSSAGTPGDADGGGSSSSGTGAAGSSSSSSSGSTSGSGSSGASSSSSGSSGNGSSGSGGGSSGGSSNGSSTSSSTGGSSGQGSSGSSSSSSGSPSSSSSSSSSSSGTGGGDGGAIGASGLPAPPTTGVAKPAGTAGNLKVLNWAGFKAAVSFTLDDTNSSQVSNYAMIKSTGVPMTYFHIGNKLSTSLSTWKQVLADGNEMANHTQDHMTISQQNVDNGDTTLTTDFSGLKVYTMAAPNGDTGYDPFAQARYFINRGANGSVGSPCRITAGDETTHVPFNACGNVTAATPNTAAQINADVDTTRTGGTWYVLVVHGFTGGTDGAFNPLAITDFVGAVNHAKMLGDVWVDTYVNVGAYWRGQNAFNKATMSGSPAAAGGQTWTWTLPAHFPPGKFLRVTVGGGTLKQNGQTLNWDTHGYYEVALDVGSLTLTQ